LFILSFSVLIERFINQLAVPVLREEIIMGKLKLETLINLFDSIQASNLQGRSQTLEYNNKQDLLNSRIQIVRKHPPKRNHFGYHATFNRFEVELKDSIDSQKIQKICEDQNYKLTFHGNNMSAFAYSANFQSISVQPILWTQDSNTIGFWECDKDKALSVIKEYLKKKKA